MALDIATWYATPSGGWHGPVVCRYLVRLRQPADLPVPAGSLVFPFVRVDAFPLAGVAYPAASWCRRIRTGLAVWAFCPTRCYAFGVLAVAHGALLAGPLANRIFFAGAALPQFKVEIAVVVVFMLCIVLGPLLMFAPLLAQAKRLGLREYGTLSQRYVREFDAKWLRGGAPDRRAFAGQRGRAVARRPGQQFRGGADDADRADHESRRWWGLSIATLAPLVPLLLTMMPLEDLSEEAVLALLCIDGVRKLTVNGNTRAARVAVRRRARSLRRPPRSSSSATACRAFSISTFPTA